MKEQLPAILAGAAVALFGGSMVCLQASINQRRKQEQLSPEDQKFFARQSRRRFQASGLIVLIGFALPVGDRLFQRFVDPVSFTLYWMAVLALVFYTALIALGDMFATRVHGKTELLKLRKQQLSLQKEVLQREVLNQQARSNGSTHSG